MINVENYSIRNDWIPYPIQPKFNVHYVSQQQWNGNKLKFFCIVLTPIIDAKNLNISQTPDAFSFDLNGLSIK